MQDYLEQLLSRKRLSSIQLEELFEEIMLGRVGERQIAAFLAAWRVLGESEHELFAGAKTMRKHAVSLAISNHTRPLADNCGTGGDGAHTFNISTASAIVAASCGVTMAKHGNRSVSSKCGSADLLFEAGFPAELKPEAAARLLEKEGFTFFFAPQFHPLMKHVMPVRKALGVRTIFNLLGPLANPIFPEIQLIGVGARDFLRPMAGALQKLGCHKGMIVHSRDGLDEISPSAVTDALVIDGPDIKELTVDPKTFGIKAELAQLKGGDATHNLKILNELLDGKEGAVSEAVRLNAGALLWLCDKSESFTEGYALAKERLLTGKTKTFFENWISKAKELL